MIVNEKIKDLLNLYRENRFSHAFLFVTNNVAKCNQDVKNLIKQISCPSQYKEECEECNICYQIEQKTLPNIIEIYPDGQLIKKNQILGLKDHFKTKPLYIKNNFYIINSAEKLNSSSANTMLKFLEEPEENIIGFFITTNKEGLLDTIKSRCQIVIVNYHEDNILKNLGISVETEELYDNIIKNYLLNLIAKEEVGLLLNKRLIISNISERKQMYEFFQYMYYFIHLLLTKKLSPDKYYALMNIDGKLLTIIQNKVFNILESLTFNVNIELLLDNFALEMEALV